MNGIAIKIGANWHPITKPEIWQACRTEEDYFRILRDRQKKGADYEPLIIEESLEQKLIPGSLF